MFKIPFLSVVHATLLYIHGPINENKIRLNILLEIQIYRLLEPFSTLLMKLLAKQNVFAIEERLKVDGK